MGFKGTLEVSKKFEKENFTLLKKIFLSRSHNLPEVNDISWILTLSEIFLYLAFSILEKRP